MVDSFHRPAIALLDEATSAMDLRTESRCLRAAKQGQGVPPTLVSVAHRNSLAKYHARQLAFGADGSWTLDEVPPSKKIQ